MPLDDGSDKSSFPCLRRFFFGDESYNNGSGSGSSGTCPFSFSSGNSVGRFSGSGSEMVKYSFPFCDGEMVNCSLPFFDGEIVNFSFSFFDGEMANCYFPFFNGEMVHSFFDGEMGNLVESHKYYPTQKLS